MAGVEGAHFLIANLVVVAELADIITVNIKPLEIAWNEGVVEPLDVIFREVE